MGDEFLSFPLQPKETMPESLQISGGTPFAAIGAGMLMGGMKMKATAEKISVKSDPVMSGSGQRMGDIAQILQDVERRLSELISQERQVDEQAEELERLVKLMSLNRTELVRQRGSLQARARAIRDQRLKIQVRRKQLENIRANAIALRDREKQAPPAPAPRVDPQTRVRMAVRISLHTEHNFWAGLSQNISEGGLFIATYEHLKMGTPLELTITLPNRPPIQVHGEVRWIREHTQFTADVSPGVGVAFTNLSDVDRQVIEGFIHTRSPLLYETGR
jgi:uncharacterized protein (TIGR02266 family)